MTRFTDNLWRDLAREYGPALAARPEPGRAPLLRRPRVLAGSTLGLAGAGTAIVLGLSAASSTPAFAVTTSSDGSVLVTINQQTSLPQADAKLSAMGIHEQAEILIATGPAAAKGPVSCKPAPGVPGPPLKVLLGQDGTEVIAPGTTGDNTGVGTWHLGACATFKTGSNAPDIPGARLRAIPEHGLVQYGNTGSGNTGTPVQPTPAVKQP